ncbi:hypothetical protein SDC9_186648 [bioreactor metagenome]|uniref:Uncharacterized protein n=1 Tax=bioreactor metagenome TaxID=1076179 RepID=A0A645HJC3_9ZZZZ
MLNHLLNNQFSIILSGFIDCIAQFRGLVDDLNSDGGTKTRRFNNYRIAKFINLRDQLILVFFKFMSVEPQPVADRYF